MTDRERPETPKRSGGRGPPDPSRRRKRKPRYEQAEVAWEGRYHCTSPTCACGGPVNIRTLEDGKPHPLHIR